MVSPRFLGWEDDASGLDRFKVEVYLLRLGTSGTLEQLGNPLITATVTPDLNNFQYTAPQPGVYAIVVTVYDGANNTARARKIFNYNDKPGFTVTDAPVYFKEADPKNRSFITKLDNHEKLTVTWAGRFISTPGTTELNARVERLPTDQNTIDDVYGDKFGLRTVNAISDDLIGVTNVSCIYLVDPKNGGRGFGDPPFDSLPDGVVVGNCSTDLDTETATLDLDPPLKNGETVVVWMEAVDHIGTTASLEFKSTLDESRPNISASEFLKNRDNNYFS